MSNDAETVRQKVRAGYDEIARSGGSCCGSTSSCCGSTPVGSEDLARHIGYSAEELAALPDGANMGLSCGNPNALAALKPGEVVLDLGSGGGFDVFIAGKKVGGTGRAIGVDMTAEMLAKARKNIEAYRQTSGLDNVEFRLGEIEHLPIADSIVDAIISNCVINLSPDKPQVWREMARVLKPGGRVAVSDLALLKPLPPAILEMVEALVGCVAGAVLVSDTERMAKEAGLTDIVLNPKAAYVDGMVDWQDPLYQKIIANLPDGTKPGEYITSLEITARKSSGAQVPKPSVRLQVYDPPMCCATGVCGPDVDTALVRFAADLKWLQEQGVEVERFNLSQSPMAFVENELVKQALTDKGEAALPMLVANSQVVSTGRYPKRQELAIWSGLVGAGDSASHGRSAMPTVARLKPSRAPAIVAAELEKEHMAQFPETSLARLLEAPTRFLFFTGKGGVGKTSLACATAIALADRQKQVLLVSTDPASNLDEVLGQKLNRAPTAIPGVATLWALNIDPEAAAQAYSEKIVGPYRGKLPEAIVRGMEEQFSGACTTEIAAFDEFARLLGQPDATIGFDHVIFDTAPTGHTLRLMKLPTAWTGFLENNTSGTSCLGPLSGLEKQRTTYEAAVNLLADGQKTTLVLVSRTQQAALTEAERTSNELAAIGVRNQRLILNGMFRASCPEDVLASALERRGTSALKTKREFLSRLPVYEVALRPHNLLGIGALRELAHDGQPSIAGLNGYSTELPELETLSGLVDDIARSGHGVVMTMGKGGVGKTTVAAAIATELARRGLRVHLSTTDPAAHVAAAVGQLDGMEVSRIDPQAETKTYVDQVMATAGKNLDESARALLEEDLRSPCTEEIAVFGAFARIVARGQYGFVVLDTAPTGHTLLLLDATEAYHRELARKASNLPAEVKQLLPRLRDPNFTRVLLLTLPEATPVHEAASLQADLKRAQIEPFAWVINQSLARAHTTDPVLLARGRDEASYIREVSEQLSRRAAIVSWVPEEPVGPEKLRQLFQT